MTSMMRYNFVLFGPLKGHTKEINGHQFIDGECEIIGKYEHVGFTAQYLSKYQAYAEGSIDYKEALAKEVEDGLTNGDEKNTESGITEEISDSTNQGRRSASESDSTDSEESTSTEDGDRGADTNGDGHEDTRLPIEQEEENNGELIPDTNIKLTKAINSLDPENDDHWTKAGLPKLDAVELAYGRAGVTRADVEEISSGFTRDLATLNAMQ